MFDPFFAWVESTALHTWIVESPSLFAFPGILAAHTIGLAFLAGVNGALDVRLLGFARGIPPATFVRLLPVMRAGLWLNVFSGIALLIGYPTKAFTNPVFYVKLGLIAAALIVMQAILQKVKEGAEGRAEAPATKTLAVVSLLLWASAITAGRLLAYTCTRLTVTLRCT